jgi:hypothetical protein
VIVIDAVPDCPGAEILMLGGFGVNVKSVRIIWSGRVEAAA